MARLRCHSSCSRACQLHLERRCRALLAIFSSRGTGETSKLGSSYKSCTHRLYLHVCSAEVFLQPGRIALAETLSLQPGVAEPAVKKTEKKTERIIVFVLGGPGSGKGTQVICQRAGQACTCNATCYYHLSLLLYLLAVEKRSLICSVPSLWKNLAWCI